MFTSTALSTNVVPLSSEPWGSARRLDWTGILGWGGDRSGRWGGWWPVKSGEGGVLGQIGTEGYVRGVKSEVGGGSGNLIPEVC